MDVTAVLLLHSALHNQVCNSWLLPRSLGTLAAVAFRCRVSLLVVYLSWSVH